MSQYINKYVKIEARSDILCIGKILYEKTNSSNERCQFISIDNKWFFNVKSKNISVTEVDDSYQHLSVNSSNIFNLGLKIDHWRQSKTNANNYDVIYDYSYDEIDKEIKPLCDAINNNFIGLKTITSCCGHNKRPAWIQIEVSDIKSLQQLLVFVGLSCFKDYFNIVNDFYLFEYTLKDVISQQMFLLKPTLYLISKHCGNVAYDAIDKLTKYINNYKNMFS